MHSRGATPAHKEVFIATAHALTMRKGILRAFFLLPIAFTPLPVHADPVSVGVTAAVTTGTSNRLHSTMALPVVPVPLLSLRVPVKRFELFAEGVPPIGPIPYGGWPHSNYFFNGIRPTYWQGTKVSYAYAALRYRLTKTVSIGIGQTLYNQQTTQAVTTVFPSYIHTSHGFYPATSTHVASEVDSSRVPGMRYEVGARIPVDRITTLSGQLALTPSMHARINACLCDRFTTVSSLGTRTTLSGFSLSEPETASEVDATLGVSHRIGRFKLSWGLRYLNYIARYDGTRALADRNTLVLPFIGVERALGTEPATYEK